MQKRKEFNYKSNLVLPTSEQFAWQELEYRILCSFGINTFRNTELGTGREDPATFNPIDFNADQWVEIIQETGCQYLILVTKHHEGFCLWPSKYTDYSVIRSPWQNGKGDVVREVADACARKGLKFGIYLSPYDMHELSYGDERAYNVYFKNQLTELLTNYGEIFEVWFDGAYSRGHTYDWPGICKIVQKYQPDAMIFNMGEATIRWSGNEYGIAPDPCWNVVEYPVKKDDVSEFWSYKKDDFPRWMPVECDVPIRKNWFWHTDDAHTLKSLDKLTEIYYKSVGCGANLLLGIAPDRRGQIPDEDAKRMKELGDRITQRFSNDIGSCNGEGDRFEISLNETRWVDHIVIREDIKYGERIRQWKVEALTESGWKKVCEGESIGHKRIKAFNPIRTSKVCLNITLAEDIPKIKSFRLFNVEGMKD